MVLVMTSISNPQCLRNAEHIISNSEQLERRSVATLGTGDKAGKYRHEKYCTFPAQILIWRSGNPFPLRTTDT